MLAEALEKAARRQGELLPLYIYQDPCCEFLKSIPAVDP